MPKKALDSLRMWIAHRIAGPIIRQVVQAAFLDGNKSRDREEEFEAGEQLKIEHANARNAYLGGFADGVRAALQEPGNDTLTPHAPPGITRDMISNAYSVADGRPGCRIPWVELDPLPQDASVELTADIDQRAACGRGDQ